MIALESVLSAILHHSVSCKKLRLELSSTMVSEAIWTETLGESTTEAQLKQLRVLGNWTLYSSLVHHTLFKSGHGDAFFQMVTRSILHPDIYTQFFIKTGLYAADEDPFTVEQDQVAADAFILLCAMLMRSLNGPQCFLSWFGTHFNGLFVLFEQAYTTYITHGVQYLADQYRHCFPRPAAGCRQKNVPHVGLPDGPPILKSLALLRIFKERMSPSLVTPLHPRPSPHATRSRRRRREKVDTMPETTSVPCAQPAMPPILPSPTVFATFSTLEQEHNLRCELISRKEHNTKDRRFSHLKISRQVSNRPFSNITNLPLRYI
ncbi:hypothetical protein C8R46DRAFT_395713 [Mycena filopes]|nr:hypothetical protein C8R46DRAFT_395713 [Mycena filopes]